MPNIKQNHPIDALLLKRSTKNDAIPMDDYHHFDNLRRYLEDLAKQYPKCISRTGKKGPLLCSCCSIFNVPTVCCAVAAYLMHYGKTPKLGRQLIVLEWIRTSKVSDDVNGNLPYRLPYLPFSEYDDMLRDEGIVCFDIPLDILQSRFVCKTTIMTVLGVGVRFWKTCHEMLSFGPKTNALVGNSNANKSYMTDTLDIFFTTIKELSEPVATLVVRTKTESITNIKLKHEEVGIHYLPPFYSKRRLYERYCYESGHVVKLNNEGKYTITERDDEQWVDDDDVVMDVLSWSKFLQHWENKHSYLRIRKPAKDICQHCFRFSQFHKYRSRTTDNGDNDDDNDDSSDTDDDNQYDDVCIATGIIRQSEEEIVCRENCVTDAAEHVADARNMREYANEKVALCKSTNLLEREEKVHTLVCDFSQNGELPSYGSEQPGEVYYFSALSIFIFGIVDTNEEEDKLTTYCYDEGVGKKGGNNVASLLMKHLRDTVGLLHDKPMKELNIIMDNCAGQNKNKMVLRLAAFLVESKYFKTVNFIFYVVGHTKNPADRLFNLAKGSIRQQNVYTMTQFLSCMNNSDYVTAREVFPHDFYDYNQILETLYKDLTKPGVKKWQIFSVGQPEEGQQLTMVFKSSNRNGAPMFLFPMIKDKDNRKIRLERKPVQLISPGRKDIKQVELYTKFRKFVPKQFQDESCPKPTEAILERFKIEKTNKVRVNKEKKEEEHKRNVQNVAQIAADLAIAEFMAPTRAVAVAVARNNNNKKRKNNDNVFEA
jgi:hypothetical protein